MTAAKTISAGQRARKAHFAALIDAGDLADLERARVLIAPSEDHLLVEVYFQQRCWERRSRVVHLVKGLDGPVARLIMADFLASPAAFDPALASARAAALDHLGWDDAPKARRMAS